MNTNYATAIRTRVLEPLGMSQTALETVGAPAIQTVGGHDADGDPAPGWTFDVLAGCGAVVATPNDMLRYARANLGATAGTLDPALRVAQRPQRDADLTGAIVQPGQPAQTATLAAAGPHT